MDLHPPADPSIGQHFVASVHAHERTCRSEAHLDMFSIPTLGISTTSPHLPHILRPHPNLLSPLSNRIPALIPTQRFPHIVCILAIIIIIHYPPVHTIPHLAIQLLRARITRAHKQIHKPAARGVG